MDVTLRNTLVAVLTGQVDSIKGLVKQDNISLRKKLKVGAIVVSGTPGGRA
jgi:hypothetical protein